MIKRTLYFGNPAYLSCSNQQLVVKLPEVEKSSLEESLKKDLVRTIPIEDIGVVIIDHSRITVTSGALSQLLDNNTAVITCDGRSMPNGLLLPLNGNNVQNERFRDQLNATIPLKKQLWQQTISQKIANQSKILHLYTETECGCMDVWSKEVRSGDPDNLEARAAAYYWKNVFPSIDEFTRGRDGDYPNIFLNYGYAILRAIIARSLVSSGLLPTLGIHHQNRYNAYCLADDIMEPYRTFVDQVVIKIMKKYPAVFELNKAIKAELLSIPVIDVVIRGKRSPLMVAASMTTSSLAKCFCGEIRKIDYPTM